MMVAQLHLLLPSTLHLLLLLCFITQIHGWRGVVGRVEMRTEISQRYSSTCSSITIHNPHPHFEHLSLALTLPAEAYVSSLTIETEGRNITTKVQEKEKRRGTKPSGTATTSSGSRRLSWQETQRFRPSVHVSPFGQATFYISYEQLLHRARGRYTYSLHLPPHSGKAPQEVQVRLSEKEAIQDFQVLKQPNPGAVTLDRVGENEITITYRRGEGKDERENENLHLDTTNNTTASTNNSSRNSRSRNSSRSNRTALAINSSGSRRKRSENNEMVERNMLIISYDVQRSVDGGEIQILGKFFVHYLSPEGLPKLPAHTVFALDVSGSMSDHGKLDKLKKAIIAIIRSMSEEDSFEVLVFSTRVKSLGVYQALPQQVEEGVARIQALQALGGTNINDALMQAVMGANTHNSTHAPARQVVFLTDGKPNIGERRPDQLRRNVREVNRHQLPVFSLALGQDADVRLLRQVSSDNEGFTRMLDEEEEPGEELEEFYSEIAKPLLTDVNVLYRDDVIDRNSVIRHGPSNFYAGSEVVFSGRLHEGVKEVHPVVAGRGRQGPLQLKVSRTYTADEEAPKDNHVERLWAYLAVQDLLDAVEIVDDRYMRVEMKARAKEIAVKYQFVTKLTTLQPEESNTTHAHPGLKSGSSAHKLNTDLLDHDLELLSPSAIADTLPPTLGHRVRTLAPSALSFGDNDPHFVVQVPGMSLPFCFDIHASSGKTLSLIDDPHSGVLVNGQVTAAVGRPGNTYFTSIFISIGGVNFTVTTTHVTISCLDSHGRPTVDGVASSLWPSIKKKSGRRRHKNRKDPRTKRKSKRRKRRRGGKKRTRNSSRYTERKRRRRGRRRERSIPQRSHPQEFWRRLYSYKWAKSIQDNLGNTYHSSPDTYTPTDAIRRFQTQAKTTHENKSMTNHLKTNPMTYDTRRSTTISDRSRIQHQDPITTHSRSVRESSRSAVIHPQAREFIHPQAGVDFSQTRQGVGARRGRWGERSRAERDKEREKKEVMKECNKTLSWRKMSERRYGRVLVMLRNHRKLDFTLGDVDLSLVVTRSRNSHGQHFLGVYLERRSVLSPNTTGIIGQFVYKTVGTVVEDRPGDDSASKKRVRLAVLHSGPQRTYQVSEVNAFLSSRRSLLHKTKVTCLFIRNQGRGLVYGGPEDYLKPCLSC